jgi:hypothetical protein
VSSGHFDSRNTAGPDYREGWNISRATSLVKNKYTDNTHVVNATERSECKRLQFLPSRG